MLLNYKCDRFNVFRALLAPVIFLYPYFFGLPDSYEIISGIFLWCLLSDSNHILHLHIHHAFSKNKYFNILLDACLGMVTGMVASNWKIHHVYGHHQRGNSKKNINNPWQTGKTWELEKFTIIGALWYSSRISPRVFFLPIIEAYKKGIKQDIKTPINFRYAFFEQLIFILFVLMLIAINPLFSLAYLLPWYSMVYFFTCYTDYLNHFSCGDGIYDSSNNSLNYWYNKLGCNFGYHSAHHYKPNAHWSLLPAIHAGIKDKISDKHLKSYSWSGFMIPYHFYLHMKGRL